MREMVLNHASISGNDKYAAVQRLREIAAGMSTLRLQRAVTNELKSSLELHEVECAEGFTLHGALLELIREGARDEYLYLSRLSVKAPLREVIDEPLRDRLLRCGAAGFDAIGLSARDAEPLLYCAIADSIAVGFPSVPIWDSDQLEITFEELLPNDEYESRTETIDNLTRAEHANPIVERHRTHSRRRIADFRELWERRESLYTNLEFGPDVEDHLKVVNPGDLPGIVKKLSTIDDDAEAWQVSASARPDWSAHVTSESSKVRNNPALINARRFRSTSGPTEIFEWHARFGNSGRIHLRFDAPTKLVEIGYIGTHLPL